MSADDDVLKTYRTANALLQEQASAATRAAILAAAACADAARPLPGSSRSVPSIRVKAGWRSWLLSLSGSDRLPVAAAATVLVSVLAWQIGQFAPGREDVVHSAAQPAPAPASAPTQTAEAPRRADVASNDNAQERATHAGAGRVAKIAGREASGPSDGPLTSSTADAGAATTAHAKAIVAEAARPSLAERPSAAAGANAAAAAPKPAASVQITTAKRLVSPKSEAPSNPIDRSNRSNRSNRPNQSLGPTDTGPRESESDGRVNGDIAGEAESARPSAPASAAARLRAEPVERTAPVAGEAASTKSSAPLDLDRWVARIVQLRRDGRDAEADAELKQLRAHYPDAKLPPAAERNALGTQ